MEELMESDLKKKNEEIKKIKEDQLKKERASGDIKAKVADLEKENEAKTVIGLLFRK